MRKPVRNIGASVRSRLLNLAQERNQPFDLLLTRYVLERLLYRLTLTNHRERFVLKGALLMTTWLDDPHRPPHLMRLAIEFGGKCCGRHQRRRELDGLHHALARLIAIDVLEL